MATNWHECVCDSDYEISDEYPYPIKRKGSDKIISEHVLDNGYVQCFMNQKPYKKHRIVATQFIPNPNNLPDVDHINHDRTDNHIENLRWISKSDNQRNRTAANGVTYDYFDTIPDDAIEVNEYCNHQFEFYYYSEEDDSFYFYTGHQYRKLHVNIVKKSGAEYVDMRDTNNKRVKVCLNKFKKLYDIDF